MPRSVDLRAEIAKSAHAHRALLADAADVRALESIQALLESFSPHVAPRFSHMSEINSLFSFFVLVQALLKDGHEGSRGGAAAG